MFRRGSEEDAHECLRFILERMHESCLGKKSNSESQKKFTMEQEMETFIYRTFGFKTVSCVHCTSCGHNSLTFDPALDISLDVKGLASVSDSFRHFYKADVLKGDNKYLCDGCKKRVVAKKFSRLCTAPRVLTVHLKRFSFSAFGPTKYQKFVEFKPRFSLEINGLNYVYDLYGVLVHTGVASMGHYFSFMKSPSGKWYLFDDEDVKSVNLSTVLKQNAYILFYAQSPSSMATPSPLPSIPSVSLPEDDIDIFGTGGNKKKSGEVISVDESGSENDEDKNDDNNENDIMDLDESESESESEDEVVEIKASDFKSKHMEMIEKIKKVEKNETIKKIEKIEKKEMVVEKEPKKKEEEKKKKEMIVEEKEEEEPKKVKITAQNLPQKKIVVSKHKKLIFKETAIASPSKQSSSSSTSPSASPKSSPAAAATLPPQKKKVKLTSYNDEKLKEDEATHPKPSEHTFADDDDDENNSSSAATIRETPLEQPRKSAWKLKSEERQLKKATTIKELYSGSRTQFGEKVGKWDDDEGEGGNGTVDTRERELSRLVPRVQGPSKWDEDYDAPKPQKKKKKVDVLGKDHSKTFDKLQMSKDAKRRDPGRFDKMAPGKKQARINKKEKQDKRDARRFNKKFSNEHHHGHGHGHGGYKGGKNGGHGHGHGHGDRKGHFNNKNNNNNKHFHKKQ